MSQWTASDMVSKIARGALRLCAWLAPISGVAAVMPWIHWISETLRHFTLYGLVACLVFSVYALGKGYWCAAVLNTAATVILFSRVLPHYRPVEQTAPGLGGAPFTVLTCNLLYRQDTEEGYAAGIRALEEADADVVILQEFTREWQRRLQPFLARYPHQESVTHEKSFGIWMGSRLPVTSTEMIHLGPEKVAAVRMVLPGEGGGLCILGMHAYNPMMPDNYPAWRNQIGEFPALLDAVPSRAAILVGDMNCTPFAITYQQMISKARLTDSRMGRGLSPTWTSRYLKWTGMGIPIDHVLIRGPLRVEAWERGPVTASDHRYVKVTLR